MVERCAHFGLTLWCSNTGLISSTWTKPERCGSGISSSTFVLAAGRLRAPGDPMPADLVLEPHDPFEEGLGPRRAAGDVHVHRDHQVHALDHVVAVFEVGPAAERTRPHGDHVLRLGHLVVEPPDAAGHLVGHRAGHDHQVGLPRRGPKRPRPETVQVEAAGPGRHHLDRATGQSEGHRPQAPLPGPIEQLLQGRGDDSLGESPFNPRVFTWFHVRLDGGVRRSLSVVVVPNGTLQYSGRLRGLELAFSSPVVAALGQPQFLANQLGEQHSLEAQIVGVVACESSGYGQA